MACSRMVGLGLAFVMVWAGANAGRAAEISSRPVLHHRVSRSLLRHARSRRRHLRVRRHVRHSVRALAARSRSRARLAKGALRPKIGRASWYDLPGRITASGEPFRPKAATAAHRTLPLFSYARVTDLNNGRSIVVEINDRGPHVPRVSIDLSKGAAAKLHMLREGVVRVLIEPLSPSETAQAIALDQSALAAATR